MKQDDRNHLKQADDDGEHIQADDRLDRRGLEQMSSDAAIPHHDAAKDVALAAKLLGVIPASCEAMES